MGRLAPFFCTTLLSASREDIHLRTPVKTIPAFFALLHSFICLLNMCYSRTVYPSSAYDMCQHPRLLPALLHSFVVPSICFKARAHRADGKAATAQPPLLPSLLQGACLLTARHRAKGGSGALLSAQRQVAQCKG